MATILTWKDGFKNGLPIFLGYIAVSFTFGVAAKDILTPLQAVFMSATNFASAGQVAALGLILASASFWEMAATQLVVNMRYSLMACSFSQRLDTNIPAYHRLCLAMGLTDEVFGLCTAQPDKISPSYAYGIMCAALPGWVLGTFLGSMSHAIMPPIVLNALGITIYAMFLAIILPAAKGSYTLALVIIVSMASSFLCELPALAHFISPSLKILVLTVVIASGAALLFPVGSMENPNNTSRKHARAHS